MKKICKVIGLLSALALGTTIVSASEIAETIQGTVPFSFVVGSKVFPAGEYTFKETESGLIIVQGQGTAGMALSIASEPLKSGSTPGLHFTATDGRQYLSAVEGATMSRELPRHVTDTRTLTTATAGQ